MLAIFRLSESFSYLFVKGIKLKYSNPVNFLLFFLIAFSAFYLNRYTPFWDDLIFSKIATENSATDPIHLNWVLSRYFTWSSRIWLEFSVINVINHFFLWSLISAAMLSMLIVSIGTMSYNEENLSHKFAFCFTSLLLFASLPQEVLKQAVVWMTGGVFYVWPSAFAFLGFCTLTRIINKGNQQNWLTPICYISLFLSSFSEQILVVNLLFCSLLLIFYKKNDFRLKPLIIAVSLSLLVLIFIVTCPGNKLRYYSEITSWFKDYGSLNLFEKAMFGLNLYADMLFANKTLIPAVFAFSLSIICEKKLRIFPIISACFLVTIFLITTPPHIFQKIQFNVNNIISTISILRVSLALILTALIFFPILISFKTKKIAIFISAMLLGCIASVSMLGFSPTVYASSARVYFIPYLTLITASLVAIHFFLNRFENKSLHFDANQIFTSEK